MLVLFDYHGCKSIKFLWVITISLVMLIIISIKYFGGLLLQYPSSSCDSRIFQDSLAVVALFVDQPEDVNMQMFLSCFYFYTFDLQYSLQSCG